MSNESTASIDFAIADEKSLRECKVPCFDTIEQLMDFISVLTTREHDYGTSAYAMSLAATAAFQYVARKEGCTGFQASCADFDFLRRSRGIDGPFMLIKGDEFLFPQYDPHNKLSEFSTEINPWLREKAAEKLKLGWQAHPRVVAHWESIVKEAS